MPDILCKGVTNPNWDLSEEWNFCGCTCYLSEEQGGFRTMLALRRITIVGNPMDADFVIFTGGSDVTPSFYGQADHPKTRYCFQRDEKEKALYELCLENGIPMVGVCRGSQFLHVMNGGKLYQHVEGHLGNHPIITNEGEVFSVTSTHHQMVKKQEGMNVLAFAQHVSGAGVATRREMGPFLVGGFANSGPKVEVAPNIDDEVEAYFYENTLCFGVQGHPEYKGVKEFTDWFFNNIEEIFNSFCRTPVKGTPRQGLYTNKQKV